MVTAGFHPTPLGYDRVTEHTTELLTFGGAQAVRYYRLPTLLASRVRAYLENPDRGAGIALLGPSAAYLGVIEALCHDAKWTPADNALAWGGLVLFIVGAIRHLTWKITNERLVHRFGYTSSNERALEDALAPKKTLTTRSSDFY